MECEWLFHHDEFAGQLFDPDQYGRSPILSYDTHRSGIGLRKSAPIPILATQRIGAMNIFVFLVVLALLATVAALASGVVSMIRGGEYDHRHSTQLMFTRVGFQGITIVLLLIALVVANI